MLLHELQPNNPGRTKKTRVGRGGKRGTYSGRGQNGQKQHAGRRIKPAISNLIIRLPKLRGFKNKPLSEPSIVINLKDLSKIKGSVVNKEALINAGLITKRDITRNIKVLSDGEVMNAYTVKELSISKLARQKIEKAGGTIEDSE